MGLAIETVSLPVFYGDRSNEPFMPYPMQLSMTDASYQQLAVERMDNEYFLEMIDGHLAATWNAMMRFCLLVNCTSATGDKFSERLLLEATTSIVYRLLFMSFASGSLSEAIRLALLAFSSQVFLQMPNSRMRSSLLSRAYRNCLAELGKINESLLIWLLVIGATSACTATDQEWLKSMLGSRLIDNKLGSWEELRGILKCFPWIGLILDWHGKAVFDSIISL